MANEIASMIENPEYQQTVQKIMQAPPALRALANIAPADEAYMKDLMEKNLVLRKIGEAKTDSTGKINLGRAKLDLEKTLGLGTSNSYYNLKLQNAQDALDLQKSQTTASNLLGAANVGAGIYGAYNQNKNTEALLPYYMKRMQGGV